MKIMSTKVEFLSDSVFRVITVRGEELNGYLTVMPAQTEDEKVKVMDIIAHCFDRSESCAQAINSVPVYAVERLLFGIQFEFVVTPIEAQRRRVGSRIRELREAKGMSARELAFLTKIDPSNLSKIESGKHAAGLDLLNRIAYYMDAEVQINPKPNSTNNFNNFSRTLDNM